MPDTTALEETQSRTQPDRNVPRGATVLWARAHLHPVPQELSLMPPGIQRRVIVRTAQQVCHQINSTYEVKCIAVLICFILLYPPQTVFVGGYNVFTLSVRPNERTKVCP